MPDSLNDKQLRDLVAKVNAQDTDRITSLLHRFSRDEGILIQSVGEYHARLGLGGDAARYGEDIGPDSLDFYENGAQAFLQVLNEHPIFYEERGFDAGIPIFGNTEDPFFSEQGRDISELLVAGALAIGFLGAQEPRYVDALTHVAFNADAISTLLRTVLSRKPIPQIDDLFHIPDKLKNLYQDTCVLGVKHALNDFGVAAASNKGTSWSTGIARLRPNYGCAGDQIAIHGIGFGRSQPSGVEVWFPTRDGRCTKAQVVPSWSDTKIVVVVPANVGEGCVGFEEFPSNPTPLTESASTLAGEMVQCFGKVAFAAARKIETVGKFVLVVPCPPCLLNGANYFRGGPPVVDWFSIGGRDNLVVEPDTELTLDWRVRYATSVWVRRTSVEGPFIDVTGPIQQSNHIGKFTGTKPAEATYELTATNTCGTITRTIRVRLRKTPALKILGVEVIQAIQRFALANPALNNTVRLVANKRTMVRVYVDSGITDNFDSGSGPNRQPNVTGTVTIWPSGANQGFGATPVNPGGGNFIAPSKSAIQRGTLTDTMNFELPRVQLNGTVRIEARIWVEDHENEVGTGWYTYDLNTVVNFEPRRTQWLMRIRVRDDDPSRMIAAPTAAQYTTMVQDATTRYPIAENGFFVNFPPGFEEISTNAANADLGQVTGWGHLLDHIDWIAGQFQNQGEIWTALTPRSPMNPPPPGSPPGTLSTFVYAVNGISTTGPGQFAAQNGMSGTFAHEMGHTFAPPAAGGMRQQIAHAPCPPPCPGKPSAASPADIDTRLPAGTEDIGMDIAQGTLIPAGRGEIMSYCGDLSSCPGPTRWPSIAFWDLIFDELV